MSSFYENDDLPSCSICLHNYNSTTVHPMVLGCGHTFCDPCLLRFQKPYRCPTCRHEINRVAVNYALLEQIDTITKILKQLSVQKSVKESNSTTSSTQQKTSNGVKSYQEDTVTYEIGKTLAVFKLDPNMNADVLRCLFEQFGDVVSARIVSRLQFGVEVRFGVVQFEIEDEARFAAFHMHDRLICGQRLHVGVYSGLEQDYRLGLPEPINSNYSGKYEPWSCSLM